MEITYLKREYVEEVARIIGIKFHLARLKLPILSDKFENYHLQIEELNKHIDDQNFLIVIDENCVVGFMYAYFINNFKGPVKGALALSSMHGVNEGYDKNKVYNLLYNKISELWANAGCYTHCILLNVNDEDTLNNWFLNGFGLYVIDVVRSLEKIETLNHQDSVSIRQATVNDLPNMVSLFKGIDAHLAKAPIFLFQQQENIEYIKQMTDWLSIENNILWIAEENSKIVGFIKTNTQEINLEQLQDGKTMGINGAYVLPDFRGRQISVRLINKALEWAQEFNLERCSSDFETANIEGRNLWLKHFSPYSYALIRRIDERNFLK